LRQPVSPPGILMNRPRFLVAGPPCGGKTTYVRDIARPGETILDFDDITEVLGGERYGADFDTIKKAHSLWGNRLLDSDWVIWCAPRRTDRGRFRSQFSVGVIVVLAAESVCLERAAAERPPSWQRAIREWFALWEPSRSGRELIVRTDAPIGETDD